MAMVSKTSRKRVGPTFTPAPGGTQVRVSPGKGGVKLGTPTHCTAKRAHSNVKSSY